MMKSLTRQVLAFTLCAFAVLSQSAKADIATQCSIDHAISGATEFQQCPVSTENNGIPNAGFDGARLDAANTKSQTPIWAYNQCRYVDNSGTGSALFIPLKSALEWESFIANPPSNVHFAGCCEPRAMLVSDVPTPPTPCTSGWVLKGIVDTTNHKVIVATPDTQSPTSGFNLATGQKEDASYPVITLPINRDDSSIVLPDNANPSKTYAAQYACGTNKDYFVDFHLQCKNAQWLTDTSEPAPAATAVSDKTTADVKTTDVQAATAQPASDCPLSQVRTYTKPCADGSAGKTSYRQVFNPCTKQMETQTLSNSCAGVTGGISGGISGCLATSDTSVTACPINQTGNITIRTDHICDGSNNGDGRDNTTIVSNTCTGGSGGGIGGGTGGGTGGGIGGGTGGGITSGCVPFDGLTTTRCPDLTAGGIITLRRVIVCDGSNGGAGTTTETVFANNCAASGCQDSTILKTSTVCHGGTLVTAKVYNSCTKQISSVVVSSTCQ